MTVRELIEKLQGLDPEALVRTESGEGLTDVLSSDTHPGGWQHEPTVHLLFYGDPRS